MIELIVTGLNHVIEPFHIQIHNKTILLEAITQKHYFILWYNTLRRWNPPTQRRKHPGNRE